ncbi:MAG TPA: TIM barrel protein [Saprospiraceae bacterium]
MERRSAIRNISLASAAPFLPFSPMLPEKIVDRKFKHSVCRWCYKDFTLEELCIMAKTAGIQSIELLDPAEWDIVLNNGLQIALSNGSSLGIVKGFNNPVHHDQLRHELMDIIPKAAAKGIPQVIVFSGNRNGLTEDQGIENCAIGLDPVIKIAEKYDVRIVMELLNSKINHKDYQCDHTPWGIKLVDKVGSTHFKLLYDIYHMQVMEGDVINTITTFKDYIGHYHTAGVPGRNEIDDTQELYYPAIMRAIAETGFSGYVAQEFIPKSGDPLKSLIDSIRICSV